MQLKSIPRALCKQSTEEHMHYMLCCNVDIFTTSRMDFWFVLIVFWFDAYVYSLGLHYLHAIMTINNYFNVLQCDTMYEYAPLQMYAVIIYSECYCCVLILCKLVLQLLCNSLHACINIISCWCLWRFQEGKFTTTLPL